MLYTVDQYRILFYKKMKHHSSAIGKLCHHDISSVAATYGIKNPNSTVACIKMVVWMTLAAYVT